MDFYVDSPLSVCMLCVQCKNAVAKLLLHHQIELRHNLLQI